MPGGRGGGSGGTHSLVTSMASAAPKRPTVATAQSQQPNNSHNPAGSSRNIPLSAKDRQDKRKGSSHNISLEDKKHCPNVSVPLTQPDTAEAEVSNLVIDTAPSADHLPDQGGTDDMETGLAHNISIPDADARHVYIRSRQEGHPLALKKLNSFAKSDAIFGIIGDYPWHKTLESGPILVLCATAEQVNKLLSIDTFLSIPVSVEVAYNYGTVQGVISDASICDMSPNDVLVRLKSQSVVHLRPIYTGSGENRVRSQYTILSFRLDKLPRTVKLGRSSHRIIPYRVYASQCTNCWWFGHRTDNCSRTKVCAHCGKKDDSHDPESCKTSIGEGVLKCNNCFGNHNPDNRECPAWMKQVAVAKLRSVHQVGYHKALEIYNKRNKNSNKRNKPNPHPTRTGNPGGGRGAQPAPTSSGSYSSAVRTPPTGQQGGSLTGMSEPGSSRFPLFNYFDLLASAPTHSDEVAVPQGDNHETDPVRPRARPRPRRAQGSSAGGELMDHLGPRSLRSEGSVGLSAQDPPENAVPPRDGSDPETEFLSQVLRRTKNHVPKVAPPQPTADPHHGPNRLSELLAAQKAATATDISYKEAMPLPSSRNVGPYDRSVFIDSLIKIICVLPALFRAESKGEFDTVFKRFTDLISNIIIGLEESRDGR